MNNEDKILQILEAIQADISGFKDGQIEPRMGNEIIDKIRGLYDSREGQNNVNKKIIIALERIEAKVDVLQIEMVNIRRRK